MANRFERAQYPSKWNDTYQATTARFVCPQDGYPHLSRPLYDPNEPITAQSMSEDCLFLNIYTPGQAKQGSNLTVMVWIHGGGFKTGTALNYFNDARHLVARGNVVVVGINYRMGPLGFLSANTTKEPGNLGLYDQILALQWVQTNIAQFGGNPKSVTIFGESAGSMSVGALVLSPLTQGLFYRAIMESGAPNSYLGSEDLSRSLVKTTGFASKFNCSTDRDLSVQVECLRKIPLQDIVNAATDDIVNGESFIPVYHEALLPQAPTRMLRNYNRNIDLLFGVNRNEGIGFVSELFPMFTQDNGSYSLQTIKTAMFLVASASQIAQPQTIADYYSKHLTENSSKLELRDALGDVFGDFHLVCPTMFFGEYAARGVATNNNRFYAYRLMQPFHSTVMRCTPTMGVCHAEELIYVFGHPLNEPNHTFIVNNIEYTATKEEVQLSKDFIQTWTNFAKTGHIQSVGGVEWRQALDVHQVNSSVGLMELQVPNYRMVDNYFKERCDGFWKPILFT